MRDYPPRKGAGTLHGITRQEKDEQTIAGLKAENAALRQALQKAHDEEGVCSCGDTCALGLCHDVH